MIRPPHTYSAQCNISICRT
uniref:Uncharacterized protein n=1 Tax=Arundo donax TaxID=35708 RepID=A0A0A9B1T6_ARUDO